MKQAGFRREEIGWQEVSLYRSKYQLGCIYALRNYFLKKRQVLYIYTFLLSNKPPRACF